MLFRLRLQVASCNHLGHFAIPSTPPLSEFKSPLCGGEEQPASQSLRYWTKEAAALQAIFLTDKHVKTMPCCRKDGLVLVELRPRVTIDFLQVFAHSKVR